MNKCKLCPELTTQTFYLSSVPKSICANCAKQVTEQYVKKVLKSKSEKNKTL